MNNRLGFLDKIRSNAKINEVAESALMLCFIKPNGSHTECGLVGTPTEYKTSSGDTIHLGDVVMFTFGNHRSKGYVVSFAGIVSINYGLTGQFIHLPDAQQIELEQSHTEQKNGSSLLPITIVEHNQLLEDKRQSELKAEMAALAIRQSGSDVITIDSVTEPVTKSPFALANCAALILSNLDKFTPAKVGYELIFTMLGEHHPYDIDNINAERYSKQVKVWEVTEGHYIYIFKRYDRMYFEPLAYIRIDKEMGHSPTSYRERITCCYYFDYHSILRFDEFIKSIHKPIKHYPLGSDLTEGSIELLTDILIEASQ